MHIGQRHQSLRHRGVLATVADPRSVYSIDTLPYAVSIWSLLFAVAHVCIIWVEHNARGVALLSWIFYTVSALVWFYYDVVHTDKLIAITNAVWMAFYLCIVIGVVVYS